MLKNLIIIFFILFININTDAQRHVWDKQDSGNVFVELKRGPQKIFLTVDHYTRKFKTLRRFSISNLSVGGLAVAGGIYLVATANSSSSPETQEFFGRLGIGGGSLAIAGGIVGLIMANKRLYKIKNKVDLHINEREGKIIYKF